MRGIVSESKALGIGWIVLKGCGYRKNNLKIDQFLNIGNVESIAITVTAGVPLKEKTTYNFVGGLFSWYNKSERRKCTMLVIPVR